MQPVACWCLWTVDPQVVPITIDTGAQQFVVNPLIFQGEFLSQIHPSSANRFSSTYRVQLPTVELVGVLNPERHPVNIVKLFERLLRLLQTILDLSSERKRRKADAAFELNVITNELRAIPTPDLAAFAVLASLVRAERVQRECDKMLTIRCRRDRTLGYDLFVFAKRHRLSELCGSSISQAVVQYGPAAESRFGVSLDDLKLAFTPTFQYDPVLALYSMARVDAELYDITAEQLFVKVHREDFFVEIPSLERMRHLREWMLDARFIAGGILKFALELIRHLRISDRLDPYERADAELTLQLLKQKIDEHRYRRRFS